MERHRSTGGHQVRPYLLCGAKCFSICPLLYRAMLRFALLRITRRPVLSPPIPERDIDPANLPPPSNTSSPTLAPSSPPSSPPLTPEHLRNNHVPLHPHPLLASPLPQTKHTSPVEDYLLSKALTTASVKTPTSLVRPLVSPKEWLSESLYIIRPLIYGKSTNRVNVLSAHSLISALPLLQSHHAFGRPEI